MTGNNYLKNNIFSTLFYLHNKIQILSRTSFWEGTI